MGRCEVFVGRLHHHGLTRFRCRTTKEHFRLPSTVCNDKFPKKVRDCFSSPMIVLDVSTDHQVLRG